jgi:hypothetical protein
MQAAVPRSTALTASLPSEKALFPLAESRPTFDVVHALPPLQSLPLNPGVKRTVVDSALGAPTRTVGTTALYSYMSSASGRKVMAGYFDKTNVLQRFARYTLKDGKVFDELSQTELSQGDELSAVRSLLGISAASGPAATTSASPK